MTPSKVIHRGGRLLIMMRRSMCGLSLPAPGFVNPALNGLLVIRIEWFHFHYRCHDIIPNIAPRLLSIGPIKRTRCEGLSRAVRSKGRMPCKSDWSSNNNMPIPASVSLADMFRFFSQIDLEVRAIQTNATPDIATATSQ